MTSYGDLWLGDLAFAPVWEELNRREAVVFVDPAIAACCTTLGRVPPSYVELPFDTVRSVARLWFGGAFERWPRIRFVFSHGGGVLPTVADRIDKLGRPGKEPGALLHDATAQFDRVYFDTADAAYPAAMAALRAFANPQRILFGTDYPYVPLAKGSGRPRPCRDESPAKAGHKEWQCPVPDANARFLTYSQSVFSNCSASPRMYPHIRALRDGLGAPLLAGSYSPPLFAAHVPMKNSDRFGPVAHVWIQLSFQDTVS